MILFSALERIVKSDTRHFKSDEVVDAKKEILYKQEQQNARLKAKFDRLYAQRSEVVLQERLNSLPSSRASKYAIVGDEFRLRQELLRGHPVNEVDSRSGRTLLLEAVAAGYLHLVRMLIYDFHADLSCVTSLGKATALHIAVDGNFRQIASMLITHGANLNARDMFGRTPLHMVKSLSMLKLLLKYPVDVIAKTNKGLTPLGHYLQVVPYIDRIDEIVRILGTREDKRLMEVTREQVMVTREGREAEMSKWALVTDGSTSSALLRNEEEDSRPW